MFYLSKNWFTSWPQTFQDSTPHSCEIQEKNFLQSVVALKIHYLPPLSSWDDVFVMNYLWYYAEMLKCYFKQIHFKLVESRTATKENTPRNSSSLEKSRSFSINTCILFLCYNNYDLWWVVLYNCWMQTSSVVVVLYYTTAHEKHHPSVLKGWRHYNMFEVMQYEPQSATFQL